MNAPALKTASANPECSRRNGHRQPMRVPRTGRSRIFSTAEAARLEPSQPTAPLSTSDASCTSARRAAMPESEGSVHARVIERDGTATDFAFAQSEIARLRAEVEGLLKAVASRDVIGQAKGILMERYKLTAEEAFGWMRDASQHTNIKVAELSVLLAETGEWPPVGAG
ncbi:MAG: ANTAR domain-containing protein [Acidimicrobiia bacterium]|nr:ANTAR domain-containing protein [Acidimicrobiia bacterium]